VNRSRPVSVAPLAGRFHAQVLRAKKKTAMVSHRRLKGIGSESEPHRIPKD
jgi:hypothetical protein